MSCSERFYEPWVVSQIVVYRCEASLQLGGKRGDTVSPAAGQLRGDQVETGTIIEGLNLHSVSRTNVSFSHEFLHGKTPCFDDREKCANSMSIHDSTEKPTLLALWESKSK